MSQAPFIEELFKKMQKSLEDFCMNKEHFKAIDMMAAAMISTLKNRGKIISCGNGGSLCDAVHFAEELSGRYKSDRLALAAISISDPGHLTCVANDYGYDYTFSRFVEAIGQEGDILLAISTSGNSSNIIEALKVSRTKNIKTICLLGKDGGKARQLCDLQLVVNSMQTERIQEIHTKIIHTLIELIEKNLFGR